MRRLPLSLITLAALPALTQDAKPAFDATYFMGDPKAIMVACADRARAIDPKDSRLLAEYGRAYLAAGDRARAEEAFKEAAAADLHDGETHRLIAFAWLKNGYRPEALAALQQMQEAAPKDDGAFRKAAADLLQAGLPAEASALMEKAFKLSPRDADNCKDFALAAIRAGNVDLAELWSERAWSADPKGLPQDWKECLDLATAAHTQGMGALASRWFSRTIAAKPKEERMWNGVALAFADREARPSAPPLQALKPRGPHTLWYFGTFEVDVPKPVGFLGGVGQAFNNVYPNHEEFMKATAASFIGALKEAKPLPGFTSSKELTARAVELKALMGPEDVVVAIDLFKVEENSRSKAGATFYFADATFQLALYDAEGHLLRALPFHGTTDTGSWSLGGVDPVTKVPRPHEKSIPMKDAVEGAKKQLLDFASGPQFTEWANRP